MERQQPTIEDIKERAEQEAKFFTFPEHWRHGRETVQGLAIDSSSTRDVDDAIFAEPTDDGYELTVSIADVGSFMYRQPAIKTLARNRGWTRYDDGKAVQPMIPAAISEDKLSLKHKIDRPVLSIQIPVDHQGFVGDAYVYQDIVRARRLSYQKVDKLLQEPSKKPSEDTIAIRSLSKVARLLYEARHSDGILGDFIFDEDDNMPIQRSNETASHGIFIVTQAMVTANQALARYALRHDIPVLYRNYTMPSDEADQLLASTGYRATYATTVQGHDALRAPAYMHGTSPLRRFADFVNQANIAAYLDGNDYPYEEYKLREIATTLNNRAAGIPPANTQGRSQTYIPLKNQAAYLVERLVSNSANEGDVATALFRTIGNPSENKQARHSAAQYIARNPLKARQILNTAISRGDLQLRKRLPDDAITSRYVLVAEDGATYPYMDNVSRVKFASRKILERRQQVLADVATLSALMGIEIKPELPAHMAEVDPLVAEAEHKMRQINQECPMGFQVNAIQNDDGGHTASAFILVDGKPHEWTATASSKSMAIGMASAKLMTDMDYVIYPPRPRQKQKARKPASAAEAQPPATKEPVQETVDATNSEAKTIEMPAVVIISEQSSALLQENHRTRLPFAVRARVLARRALNTLTRYEPR
jgi:hypothetical protein